MASVSTKIPQPTWPKDLLPESQYQTFQDVLGRSCAGPDWSELFWLHEEDLLILDRWSYCDGWSMCNLDCTYYMDCDLLSCGQKWSNNCKWVTHCWTRNWLLWFLGSKFPHGLQVLFLFVSHEDVFVSNLQTQHITTQWFLCSFKWQLLCTLKRRVYIERKWLLYCCIVYSVKSSTYLFLLLVEIVNNDTNEEV